MAGSSNLGTCAQLMLHKINNYSHAYVRAPVQLMLQSVSETGVDSESEWVTLQPDTEHDYSYDSL